MMEVHTLVIDASGLSQSCVVPPNGPRSRIRSVVDVKLPTPTRNTATTEAKAGLVVTRLNGDVPAALRWGALSRTEDVVPHRVGGSGDGVRHC